MKAQITITKVETGESVTFEDDWYNHSHFDWTENNNSCDCNREIRFNSAKEAEFDFCDSECSEGRFLVKAVVDGEVLIDE